ncbi:MAG: hypothetical protein P8Y18_04725 [Candidatus Bathyarchaeota archaeon]
MKDDWDKEKIKDEMEKSKEEFLILTTGLMDSVVKFCVRALKTFEAGKGEELNHNQINEVATKEVYQIINQISNPEFINLAAKKAENIYLQNKTN